MVCGMHEREENCIKGTGWKSWRKETGRWGIVGKIILNRSSGNVIGLCGLYLSSTGYRQVARSCECGNEPSVVTKCEELLTSKGPISFSRGIAP